MEINDMVNKYFKFDDGSVVHIEDVDVLENANAYVVKTKDYTYDRYDRPFKFKDFHFIYVSASCMDKAKEVEKDEFLTIIKDTTLRVWGETAKRDKGQAFALNKLEVATKKSFCNNFGEVAFKELYQDLLDSLKNV